MAKKKTTKVVSKNVAKAKVNAKANTKKNTKVKIKVNTKPKSLAKSVGKSIVKLASKVLSAAKKPVTKPAAKLSQPLKNVSKKTAKINTKVIEKPLSKLAAKLITKSDEKLKAETNLVKNKKNENTNVENLSDTGSTLIEMARQEMAAVKIGQSADKAEKASKLKSIKVERGNAADEKAKWQELYRRHGKDKADTYKMTDIFQSSAPIQHKILGWGFVLNSDNDRLEVLFENGIKILISNYKPN